MGDPGEYDSSKAKGIIFGKPSQLVNKSQVNYSITSSTPNTPRFSNPEIAKVGYADIIEKAKRVEAAIALKSYETQKAQKEAEAAETAKVQAERLESARRREVEKKRSAQDLGNRLLEDLRQQVMARVEAESREAIHMQVKKKQHDWVDQYTQQKKTEITNRLEKDLEPVIEAKIINSKIGEIKDQLKRDLKPEVIKDLRQECEEEVREELRRELRADTIMYLRNELRDQVLLQLRCLHADNVINELRKDYTPQVINDLRREQSHEGKDIRDSASNENAIAMTNKSSDVDEAKNKDTAVSNNAANTVNPAMVTGTSAAKVSIEQQGTGTADLCNATEAVIEPLGNHIDDTAIPNNATDTVNQTFEKHSDSAAVPGDAAYPEKAANAAEEALEGNSSSVNEISEKLGDASPEPFKERDNTHNKLSKKLDDITGSVVEEEEAAASTLGDYTTEPDVHKINFGYPSPKPQSSRKRSFSDEEDNEQGSEQRDLKRFRAEAYAADGDTGFEEPYYDESSKSEKESGDESGEEEGGEDDEDGPVEADTESPGSYAVQQALQTGFYAAGVYNQFQDSDGQEYDEESEEEIMDLNDADQSLIRFTNTQDTAINLDDSDGEDERTLVETAGFVAVNKKGSPA